MISQYPSLSHAIKPLTLTQRKDQHRKWATQDQKSKTQPLRVTPTSGHTATSLHCHWVSSESSFLSSSLYLISGGSSPRGEPVVCEFAGSFVAKPKGFVDFGLTMWRSHGLFFFTGVCSSHEDLTSFVEFGTNVPQVSLARRYARLRLTRQQIIECLGYGARLSSHTYPFNVSP